MFFLISKHYDFLFVFEDLLALNELILHFKDFAVEVEVLEAREIVIFKVFLEFFLEGLIFVFHMLNFLLEGVNLFLEVGVGSLKFLNSDGLDEDVFVLFGSKLLKELIVELILHELVFVEMFHGKFMLFELGGLLLFFVEELIFIDLVLSGAFELFMIGGVQGSFVV